MGILITSQSSRVAAGPRLSLDGEEIKVKNNKANVDLEVGVEYSIAWFFLGDPGASISINYKNGSHEQVVVKKSVMPKFRGKHGGRINFTPKG